MIDYRGGKAVLAPMVRVSELPVRALSLRYGADLVWGPEVVDKKIIGAKRVWNEKLQCVDFLGESDNKLAFRTCPRVEKSRLVFQLGSSDPELAVQAAKVVAGDVSAIDLNCGCPKHFSIHSGMGSALLQTPDRLVAILRSLVNEVGRPLGIAVSVKIRILDTAAKTYDLVRRIVETGVSCLTVHCRTTIMRPREPAQYDYLAEVAQICHGAGVACYVNGDVRTTHDITSFVTNYGVDGGMIARGAESNPSCFRGADLVPTPEIVAEFWAICQEYDFPVAHAKYCILKMVSGKDPVYQLISRAKTPAMMDAAVASWNKSSATATASSLDASLLATSQAKDQSNSRETTITVSQSKPDIVEPASKRVRLSAQ